MLSILPLIVLLPFLAVIPIVIAGERHSHSIALGVSAIAFILTILALYLSSADGMSSLSFSQNYLTGLGINFSLQLSSLSLILTLMTAIVFLAAAIVGKYFVSKDKKLYSTIFLLTLGGAMGVFLSGNLFLFYVFWEIAEFAMFFIIFVFGGYDRRYAAIKFIIYSIIASLLLLIAIMMLYFYTTPHTFGIYQLEQQAHTIPMAVQPIILVLLLAAFMIKAPIFPFHSWLPDAHTEAPTTGSMVLAGVLLKFAGYGLLLMFLILPIAAHYAPYIAAIFGFSAIYGAMVALRQTHLKRMIAYTSIVDMGIIAIGIAATSVLGTAGAIYGMLAHGLAISLLFLLAGTIDKVYGTLLIEKLRGIAESQPTIAYLFIFGILATIGLPLTAGFIGDLLIFIGAYGTFGAVGLVPIAAIVVVGGYLFWVTEKSFFNIKNKSETYALLGKSIFVSAGFLAVATIILGILPSIMLAISNL
ncbi:MAG: NADH-quinone oxidoreductase subunit M [Candidatus Micrarchaeota archaeon]|nr:NADH-quinone oxidoreductase subunit M [Candidatus Micrarchaeota archaeon]MDE1847680.1 NADH-quinone oxidoreductase subunit M [Candidatus Micrarchaeota archaeon]MDE1864501.1 NADH-quinone oxidoreductase subunit M [Candidatus Micrarchaeota archaeon]